MPGRKTDRQTDSQTVHHIYLAYIPYLVLSATGPLSTIKTENMVMNREKEVAIDQNTTRRSSIDYKIVGLCPVGYTLISDSLMLK
jgi:hypothetical protein